MHDLIYSEILFLNMYSNFSDTAMQSSVEIYMYHIYKTMMLNLKEMVGPILTQDHVQSVVHHSSQNNQVWINEYNTLILVWNYIDVIF